MNFGMWVSKAIIGVSISAAVVAGIYYTKSARGTNRTDKRRAIKAARKARKDSVRYIDKDC